MPLGFLFVGGASRRMRRSKALLPWGKVPLYVHLAGVLGAVCEDVILVGDHIPPGYAGPSISDAIQNAGPLGGMLSVLRYQGDPWRLVVACDMPAIEPAILQGLLAQRSPEVQAVVPQTSDGHTHPLCALYHQSALAPLENILFDPGTSHPHPRTPSMHRFLDDLRVARVMVPNTAALHNVNTVRDFLAVLGGHLPPPEEETRRRRIPEAGGNLKE